MEESERGPADSGSTQTKEGSPDGTSGGVDLGTTNSGRRYSRVGNRSVPNAEGSRTTPSVVGFSKTGEILCEVAKRQAITNPDRTIRSVKRHMGAKDWSVDVTGRWTPREISRRS